MITPSQSYSKGHLNRMRVIFFLYLVGLFSFQNVLAQDCPVQGFIFDDESGEPLIGVNIFAKTLHQGTTTNNNGYFSIWLTDVPLTFSYLGYADTTLVPPASCKPFRLLLKPKTEIISTLEVTQQRNTLIEETAKTSIPADKLSQTPILLGEKDAVKVLILFPGIQSGSEGSTTLIVRGGDPGQNALTLDDATVYNPSHLLGFFSSFNTDIVKNVGLYKNHFPAFIGGRLASFINVDTKDGNNQRHQFTGGIGILSARGTLEGPIRKGQSSFLVSARRSYADLLARPFLDTTTKNSSGFYDINAKIKYNFRQGNSLRLSYYQSNDFFSTLDSEGSNTYFAKLGWHNQTLTLRYNVILSPNLFLKATGTYSHYKYAISQNNESKDDLYNVVLRQGISVGANIKEKSFATHLTYLPNKLRNHSINTGIRIFQKQFTPFHIHLTKYDQSVDENEVSLTETAFPINQLESNVFINDEIKINPQWALDVGLNISLLKSKSNFKSFLEPRFNLIYQPTTNSVISGSITRMVQHLHLLTSFGIGLPSDIWIPATEKLPSQKGWQYSMAYSSEKQLSAYAIEIGLFLKTMSNLVAYGAGSEFTLTNSNWETNLVEGKGNAKGIEFQLTKNTGLLTGWLSYTLSRSRRSFEQLNFGEPFPHRYDRTHYFNTTLQYAVKPNITLVGNWYISSGIAATLPSTQVPVMDSYGSYYIESVEVINNFRFPSYHRLDIGATFHRTKKWGKRTINLSIYNAYNHKNIYFIRTNYDSQQDKNQYTGITIFPFIPSISYEVKL